MDFLQHLNQRLTNCTSVLGLSRLSREILRLLALVDSKDDVAEDLRKKDRYDRPGVLSWRTLAEQIPNTQTSVAPVEKATLALANWGIIQIVGRTATDPIAPGPASLRMTYAGRVCLGLAPAPSFTAISHTEDPVPWAILHSASRELLLTHIHDEITPAALHPIPIPTSAGHDINRTCGEIAIQLCSNGGALVDGFVQSEHTIRHTLHEILVRTANARAPRILMMMDPSVVRPTALRIGATLRWVEPSVDTRRGRLVLDSRVTQQLQKHTAGGDASHTTGVPDSDIATPKRCSTQWEDLILSDRVGWQMKQAMRHASYRLDTQAMAGKTGYRLLLSGLPGTGKSMAAEALATALDRPLVRLDLSSVLSKWLGETEKQLSQVFDVAEAANAVLVLDEAESLLRQRNSGAGGGGMGTGVAYMLTRLDLYQGVLVATTNRIEDLDEAFFRRFDDYVVLPIPDKPTRRTLWEKHLILADDSDVDLDVIAEKFAISGGLIRGAAIRANGWVSATSDPLSTPHVLASLGRELEKNHKATNEVYIQPWRNAVKAILEGS